MSPYIYYYYIIIIIIIIIIITIIIIKIPALTNGLRKRQEKEAPRLVSCLKIRTLYLEHFLFTHDLFFLSDEN